MKINKNKSFESLSYSILEDRYIALAELSRFPHELAHSLIDDAEISLSDKEKIKSIIDRSEIFFFNRLNVPKTMSNNGYGTILMQELIKDASENNLFIINTANAYGALNQEQLISFYQKNDMVLIHSDGGLIYHKNLQPDIQLVNNKKVKKINH